MANNRHHLFGKQRPALGNGVGLAQFGLGLLQGQFRSSFFLQQGFSLLVGIEQLTLVLVTVGGAEQRQVIHHAVGLLAPVGVEQDRDFVPVAMTDVELHLGDAAMHTQHRRQVRLVKNPPAHGQQVLETPAQQLGRSKAQPVAQARVDVQDRPIFLGHRQGTRRAVKQRVNGHRQPPKGPGTGPSPLHTPGGRSYAGNGRHSRPGNKCC